MQSVDSYQTWRDSFNTFFAEVRNAARIPEITLEVYIDVLEKILSDMDYLVNINAKYKWSCVPRALHMFCERSGEEEWITFMLDAETFLLMFHLWTDDFSMDVVKCNIGRCGNGTRVRISSEEVPINLEDVPMLLLMKIDETDIYSTLFTVRC